MSSASVHRFVRIMLFGAAWAGVGALGCGYDPEKLCGDELVLGADGSCVCPPKTVLSEDEESCVPEPVLIDPVDTVPEGEWPTGLGAPCLSQEGCFGFDASYCESLELLQCVVSGCSLELNDCPEGQNCVERLEVFQPNLCLPAGPLLGE